MKCLFYVVGDFLVNFERRNGKMSVVLFSTHCPRCNVLEKKLQQKNISYEEVNDVEIMKEKGYLSVPVLEVDGTSMDFKTANDWINSLD